MTVDTSKTGALNVVHFLLLGPFIEKLLKGNFVGGIVDGRFEMLPGRAEFWGAIGVAERGGVEDFAVDGAEDIAEGNFSGRTGEQVAAFLAANAPGDAFGFQFDKDLNEIIGRDILRGSEMFDAQGGFVREMPCEAENGARGIITFNRKLHTGKLTDDGQTAIIEGAETEG